MTGVCTAGRVSCRVEELLFKRRCLRWVQVGW